MYQSQEYLEIGGKLITCPYDEDTSLHGVNLYDLICSLHGSGAVTMDEFQNVILHAVSLGNAPFDMEKIYDIYRQVMKDLAQLGVVAQLDTDDVLLKN